MVTHQPVKFGGHMHGASGDINIPPNTVILLQMADVAYVTYILAYFHHYFFL